MSSGKTPFHYVAEACENLRLSAEVRHIANELVDLAVKEELFHQTTEPTTIAAGVVYFASMRNNENRTQSQVAKAVGINVSTVRSSYGKLADYYLRKIDLEALV